MTKEEAIKRACYHYGYSFPRELFTGVLFFGGHRITIDEFNRWADKFK